MISAEIFVVEAVAAEVVVVVAAEVVAVVEAAAVVVEAAAAAVVEAAAVATVGVVEVVAVAAVVGDVAFVVGAFADIEAAVPVAVAVEVVVGVVLVVAVAAVAVAAAAAAAAVVEVEAAADLVQVILKAEGELDLGLEPVFEVLMYLGHLRELLTGLEEVFLTPKTMLSPVKRKIVMEAGMALPLNVLRLKVRQRTTHSAKQMMLEMEQMTQEISQFLAFLDQLQGEVKRDQSKKLHWGSQVSELQGVFDEFEGFQ